MPNSSKKRKASDLDDGSYNHRPKSISGKKKAKGTKRSTTTTTTSIDDIPFTTECPAQVAPGGDDDAHVAIEDLATDFSFSYAVRPGSKWTSWRSYKNVKYSDVTFTSGAIIYVNKNNPPPKPPPKDATDDDLLKYDKKNFWVARIAETRAENERQVLLRVFWLYWPEELPMGRQVYHAKDELVLSNAMDIVDATTISGAAEVNHWDENKSITPTGDRFWRQTFDIGKLGGDGKGGLSVPRKHCICEQPYNPDTTMFHCKNCSTWNHEQCLLDAIAQASWARLQQGTLGAVREQAGDGKHESLGERLLSPFKDLGKLVQQTVQPAANNGVDTNTNGHPPSLRKHGKAKKDLSLGSTASPWKGKLVATIIGNEEEEEPVLAKVRKVGKAEADNSWTVPVQCLVCEKQL